MVPCATADEADRRADRIREFFDAVSGPLLGFLIRLTRGEHHLAEDLLQETFLRAWRRIDDLPDDPAEARPWLFTVARRAAIDVHRSRRLHPPPVTLLDAGEGEPVSDIADRVVDSRYVRDALTRLSPAHQEIILEVYFRDRFAREIAHDLGIPEGTVKSRTHHAVRSLAAVLGSGR